MLLGFKFAILVGWAGLGFPFPSPAVLALAGLVVPILDSAALADFAGLAAPILVDFAEQAVVPILADSVALVVAPNRFR